MGTRLTNYNDDSNIEILRLEGAAETLLLAVAEAIKGEKDKDRFNKHEIYMMTRFIEGCLCRDQDIGMPIFVRPDTLINTIEALKRMTDVSEDIKSGTSVLIKNFEECIDYHVLKAELYKTAHKDLKYPETTKLLFIWV